MKTKKKIGIGPEGLMHKQFAALIKQYEFYKKLDCAWWSYDASGENRNAITASLLKAKGLKGGKADYEFKQLRGDIMYHIYIEIKSEKGKQSENQIKFQESCQKSINDVYYIARSVKEAIDILIEEKILLDN